MYSRYANDMQREKGRKSRFKLFILFLLLLLLFRALLLFLASVQALFLAALCLHVFPPFCCSYRNWLPREIRNAPSRFPSCWGEQIFNFNFSLIFRIINFWSDITFNILFCLQYILLIFVYLILFLIFAFSPVIRYFRFFIFSSVNISSIRSIR